MNKNLKYKYSKDNLNVFKLVSYLIQFRGVKSWAYIELKKNRTLK